MKQDEIDAIKDYLQANPSRFSEFADQDCEFGDQVVAILADRDDDKLGRINDLHWLYLTRCAEATIEAPWHGFYGNLKRAAGLVEPSPLHRTEQCPTGWREAAEWRAA